MKKLWHKGFWADKDIEILIGLWLRFGVITSSIIVFIGGLLYLIQEGAAALPAYQYFTGEAAAYTTFSGILSNAETLQAKGIIQAGVVVLIATPILRIFFSLLGFVIEKDKKYVFITLIVLLVMVFSMIGGLKV